MYSLYVTLGTRYWIITLCVLFCYFVNIITPRYCSSDNDTDGVATLHLPPNWPCQWNDGVIPFVFNFYSLSGLKRLTSLVHKGHRYLEERSCFVFKEHDPLELAKKKNYTYLYYTYSGVLENCCLPFYSKPVGRRLVMITPICVLPAEVAHATLHGLGLVHHRRRPFSDTKTQQLLFHINNCTDINRKIKTYKNAV